MKQQKTTAERTPVAGDVWWINKTTGAQDMHFVLQAFEKMAITLKLLDKAPYSDGVQVEGMWVDAKMVQYVYLSRFDVYEGGTKQETLENVQQAVVNLIGNGVNLPQDAQEVTRLRGEIARLEKNQDAKDATSDAIIKALREKNDKLEKELKTVKEGKDPAADVPVIPAQVTLTYGLAKREAEIYKELYYDLINRIVGKTTEIKLADENSFPVCGEGDIPY